MNRLLSIRLFLALAFAALLLGAGCSKPKPAQKTCVQGQLRVSTTIAHALKDHDAHDRLGCPSRLTTEGAGPPIEAWVGGTEAYWGPDLVVQLDKAQTKALRDKSTADEGAADRGASGAAANGDKPAKAQCIYTWSQNCPDL